MTKTSIKKISLYLTLFVVTAGVFSQTAPPPPDIPSSPPEIENEQINEESDITINRNLFSMFLELQVKGNSYIRKQLLILKEGFNIGTLLIIIIFSLGYGIFHTLGPGHGKMIVISYFMQKETTKFDAFSLSFLVSIIHALGAIIMAVLFQTILLSVKGYAKVQIQYGFTIFSGVFIIILGLLHLYRHIRESNGKEKKITNSNMKQISEKNRWQRNLLISISIGIVPCPLSLTIMIVSIIYGIFWVGLISVAALTIAMVLILYIISISTIKSRERLSGEEKKDTRSPFLTQLSGVLSYIGNIALILLGSYLIITGYVGLF